MTTIVVTVLLTALIAGVLGGVVMEAVLWGIGAAGWARANMIVAVGSLLTKNRDNAWRVGVAVHLTSAIGFALVYTMLMVAIGYTHLPASLMLGGGIGLVHGLVVSLGLVWIVAERHPLEEFSEAGLAIGLAHIVGHVAYGLVVGFIVGIAPL
jgi:hypothetical protein